MENTLKHHVMDLEACGPVSVYLQGDEKKLKDGVVFLTVHDVGATYQSWLDFTTHSCMEDASSRAVFLHVVVPGQEPGAPDLANFPRMAELGVALVTILDHLRVPRVVGLGDGAGANIITRFGMMHPSRCHGILTINNTASASSGRFMDRMKEKMNAFKQKNKDSQLNERNVSKFAEAYKQRTEILTELNKKIKIDVLLIAGMKSKYVGDTEAIHREMTPGLCSMIKIEEVVEPMSETPGKVAEAVLLFCQGMCLLPTVEATRARRLSRQESLGSQDGDDTPRRKNSKS